MYRIIYLSSATTKFTNDELASLLRTSRKHNEVNNITGLLLYSDGNFLQIIEGEKKKLKQLFYEKICIDKRHKDIIKVFESKVDKRLYSNWSLGFNIIHKASQKEISTISGFIINDEQEIYDEIVSIFIDTFLISVKKYA